MTYPKIFPFDAETLRVLYVEEGKTLHELALMGRCRPQRILKAMKAWGIPRRRRGRRRSLHPDVDPELLKAITRLGGRTHARAVARTHGINRDRFDRLIGDRLGNRGAITRHVLYRHDDAIRRAYEDGMLVKDLAARYGCSRRSISRSLDRTMPGVEVEPGREGKGA